MIASILISSSRFGRGGFIGFPCFGPLLPWRSLWAVSELTISFSLHSHSPLRARYIFDRPASFDGFCKRGEEKEEKTFRRAYTLHQLELNLLHQKCRFHTLKLELSCLQEKTSHFNLLMLFLLLLLLCNLAHDDGNVHKCGARIKCDCEQLIHARFDVFHYYYGGSSINYYCCWPSERGKR